MSIFCLTVLNLYMIKRAKEIDFKIDVTQDSPADYTLKFVGIDKKDTEEEIVEYINSKEKNTVKRKNSIFNVFSNVMNNASNTRNMIRKRRSIYDFKAIKKLQNFDYYEIEKASKAYNLIDFTKMLNHLEKMRKRRAKLRVRVNKNRYKNDMIEAKIYMKRVLELNKKINIQKEKIEKFRKILNKEEFSTGVAFVSFKYKHERDQFAMKYESNFWNTWIYPFNNFKYKGKKVKIYDADEPSDVIWENIGYCSKKKLFRLHLTYFFSLCAISLNFFVIYLIKKKQKESRISNINISNLTKDITEGDSKSFVYAATFLITLIIVFINSLNRIVMRFFSELELHDSQTLFNLSYSQKLSRLELINTCGIVLFTHIQLSSNKQHIWVAGGLIYDAMFILLSYIISMTLEPFFNLRYWVKILRRNFFKKRKPEYSSLLQFEVNELYTKDEVNIAYCYSKAISAFQAAAFFTPIIPLSGLFVCIALSITYWIQKIRFAKYYTRPKEVGSKIALDSIYRLGFGPLILYVKDFLYLNYFQGINFNF